MDTIELQKTDLKSFAVTIESDSELIMHAWSPEARAEMLDKQMKKGKKGKEAKDPQRQYESCFYYREDGSYGFPSIGIKAAIVRGAKAAGMVMTDVRTAFHVVGDMIEIHGTPRMREDMVRVGMGKADIRYRPGFPTWSARFEIVYNSRVVSAEQLVNMIDLAGFGVGIGDWRPEKGGSMGRFHVKTEQE